MATVNFMPSTKVLHFTVHGTPVPQGSMRAFIPRGWNRAILTADNKQTKPWKQQVTGTADQAMFDQDFPLLANGEPVEVVAYFFFDKPKSAKKSVTVKTTKPDVDKLLRAVLDSLTGTVFKDDAQVVRCIASKTFGQPRVEVTITVAP